MAYHKVSINEFHQTCVSEGIAVNGLGYECGLYAYHPPVAFCILAIEICLSEP